MVTPPLTTQTLISSNMVSLALYMTLFILCVCVYMHVHLPQIDCTCTYIQESTPRRRMPLSLESSEPVSLSLPTTPKRLRTVGKFLSSDDSEDETHTSAEITEQPPARKRKAKEKSEEDAIPLPNPFPLPKHYGSEVEAALNDRKLTNRTRKAFIAKIASSMLYHKRYPTADDYANVGQAVVQKYPFMKSPAGSPAVSYNCIMLYTILF